MGIQIQYGSVIYGPCACVIVLYCNQLGYING